MKLETLISNIRYLLNTLDIVGVVNEINSMIKYDLDGTSNDDLMGDLENLQNLLDDLETTANELETATDEIENNELNGDYDDDADDLADDETQK